MAPNIANVAPPAVLAGIATSYAVTGPGADPHVSGSQSGGVSIIGSAPYTFSINALDADGNAIIGPGMPNVALQSATSAFHVSPVHGSANVFSVRAGAFSHVPVALTIAADTSSATATVRLTTVQELWIADTVGSHSAELMT